MNEAETVRVGIGFDVHRLAPGRPLRLGGVTLPHPAGLLGHSDGDVVLHAIVDAILGACQKGDIGRLFPDTDPALKGADSRRFLAEAARVAEEAGWRVGFIDVVVVAEAPKIAPHVPAMVEVLREVLGEPHLPVSIKGKTAEGLGPLGAAEGIAALASVTMYPIRRIG